MSNNRLWFEFRQWFKDCNVLQSNLHKLSLRRISNARFLELCFWDSEISDPKQWELNLLAKAFKTKPGKILRWVNTFL